MSTEQATTSEQPSSVDVAQAQLRVMSALLDRMQLAQGLSGSFDGLRNLDAILGYPDVISTAQYRRAYERGGIATRVVDAYPIATWRGGVELYDDEDPKTDTVFETTWKELDRRLHIWPTLQKADTLAGLSTFSVILLGVSGEGALNTELPKGSPEQLVYLTPFVGEGGVRPGQSRGRAQSSLAYGDAIIDSWVENTRDPRFGQPLTYQLRRMNITAPEMNRPVHWSRIIHIAEKALEDGIFGTPTLQSVWNRLLDLEKVLGGGAEAFWLRANQGMALNLDKDMAFADTKDREDVLAKMRVQIEEYQHQIRRAMTMRGVDVKTLGSDVANFEPPADALMKQIAGTKGIPMRILTGSEMGQLASGQDADNWSQQVQDRRTNHAEPNILRQFVDRLIDYGYLTEPAVPYEVSWAEEEEESPSEQLALADNMATINQKEGSTVFTKEEMREVTGREPLSDEQKNAIADEAAQKMKQQQDMLDAAPPKPSPFGQQPDVQKAAEEQLLRDLESAIEAGDLEQIGTLIGVTA